MQGPRQTARERAIARRWRVGRRVGRTIYMQVGPEPSDADVLIGTMDTPEIAAQAVRDHNERIERRRNERILL